MHESRYSIVTVFEAPSKVALLRKVADSSKFHGSVVGCRILNPKWSEESRYWRQQHDDANGKSKNYGNGNEPKVGNMNVVYHFQNKTRNSFSRNLRNEQSISDEVI